MQARMNTAVCAHALTFIHTLKHTQTANDFACHAPPPHLDQFFYFLVHQLRATLWCEFLPSSYSLSTFFIINISLKWNTHLRFKCLHHNNHCRHTVVASSSSNEYRNYQHLCYFSFFCRLPCLMNALLLCSTSCQLARFSLLLISHLNFHDSFFNFLSNWFFSSQRVWIHVLVFQNFFQNKFIQC